MKKILILFFTILSVFTFSQKDNEKYSAFFKQADSYYQQYKFPEAKRIYNELIFKYKIDANENIDVYRKAAFSGLKCKDYWFAEKVYSKMLNLESLAFEDAYEILMLNLFLGQYEKVDDLFSLDLFKDGTGEKLKIVQKIQENTLWKKLNENSPIADLTFQEFNSGFGDFSPNYIDGKVYYSSSRNQAGKTSSLDNGKFIEQYVYSLENKEISPLKNMQYKYHDGASFYDRKNKTWYYSKNTKALKNDLTTTGIFIYNDSLKTEEAFPYNDKTYFVAQPFYDTNTNILYFSSNMPGSVGKSDIWKSTFENGSWSTPENLGKKINTIEDEMFPSIFEENFYFSSVGHAGLGGLDIFVTKLSTLDFPTNMGYPLNSYGDDFGLSFDESGTSGYYTNNRKDFLFVDNIYAFTLLNTSIEFIANIIENTSQKKPIKDVLVLVKDDQNNIIDSLYTDADGNINTKLKKDKKYTFQINHEDYEDFTENLSTINVDKDTLRRTFALNPKKVYLNTLVVNKETNEPLKNSKVSIINKETNEKIDLETDDEGKITTKLDRNKDYYIQASKKGFIDVKDSISTKIKDNEIDKVVKLDKLKAGTTIKVDNVFYDFAKATLRPESKTELDKLVDFLLKNDNIKVELSSHTDSRGSDAANKKLSQARAQSCVDYLITKGVKKDNIVAKGYGESMLVNKCKNGVKCSEEEHQANRRTEIKILSITE